MCTAIRVLVACIHHSHCNYNCTEHRNRVALWIGSSFDANAFTCTISKIGGFTYRRFLAACTYIALVILISVPIK